MENKVCVGCLELINNTDNFFNGNYYHKECFDKLNKLTYSTEPTGEVKQNFKSNQFDNDNKSNEQLELELEKPQPIYNYKHNALIADIKKQIAEIVSSEDPSSQNEYLDFLTEKLKKLQANLTKPGKTVFVVEPIKQNQPIIDFGFMGKKTLVISKNGDLVWLNCDTNGNIGPIKYREYSHADY